MGRNMNFTLKGSVHSIQCISNSPSMSPASNRSRIESSCNSLQLGQIIASLLSNAYIPLQRSVRVISNKLKVLELKVFNIRNLSIRIDKKGGKLHRLPG